MLDVRYRMFGFVDLWLWAQCSWVSDSEISFLGLGLKAVDALGLYFMAEKMIFKAFISPFTCRILDIYSHKAHVSKSNELKNGISLNLAIF